MNTTFARYLLGVGSLAVILGSLGVAAVALRRRYLAEWRGAPARIAEFVIGLALLVALLELLGAVGLFHLLPIVVTCFLIAAGVLSVVGRSADAHARVRRVGVRGHAGRAATAIALTSAAAVVALWASPMLQSYDVGIRTFDSLYYHLPWAATFARTGHITPLQYDIQYMLQFYPASAELLHGLGMLALARDTLSPAINFLWLGLTLLAAWCIGRPRNLGPLTMLGAALAMATPMIVFSQAGSADNDVAGSALLMASVAVIVCGEDRATARAAPATAPATVLAAVAAGLAVAFKLTLVGPVLALTVGVIAIARPGGRGRVAALWLVPLAVAGGFWFVRNLLSAGNPLPWVSFGFLPTPAPALQQHTGFSVAHYLTDGRFWSHFFVSGMASELGRWWWAILVAAIAGPVLCLLPGSDRMRRMLGFVALASIAAYLLTPESAQGPAGDPIGFGFNMRYLAPGLTLSLAIAPLAPALAGRRRGLAVAAAYAVVLIATVAKPALWPDAHVVGAAGIGLAALLIVVIVLLATGPGRARGRAWRLLAVAGAALLLTAATAAGFAWQRHYLRGRYAFHRGVSYLARTWAMFRSIRHARVGVAGTYGGFFTYPLFGPDMSNTVQYIARRGPHGSFTPIGSCPEFRAAVNAARPRYLVTTPGRDFWRSKVLRPSPEARWTASDPAARLIYSRRAAGQPIDVFELTGPLDPSACP